MKLRVKKFEPDTMKPHRLILIVGKRGTGKSILQRDLMYFLKDKVDFAMAMSPTEESLDMFRQHMHESWLYNNFSGGKLDAMLNVQRDLAKQKKQKSILLMLDDCCYDKKIMKGETMRYIHCNGRHVNLTFCNAVQYCMDLTPDLRSQIDYIFCMRENIISNRMKLWKYFFGMFEKYEDFSKVMDKCTANYSSLVMDNTIGSNNVEDSVFWYRASIDLPQFRVGSDAFWQLSRLYEKNAEDQSKEDLMEKEMLKKDEKVQKRISFVHCEDDTTDRSMIHF